MPLHENAIHTPVSLPGARPNRGSHSPPWSSPAPGRGQVTVLHLNVETGAVVKIHGNITAVGQARARFSVTGSQDNQEDLLPEGAPVYLN